MTSSKSEQEQDEPLPYDEITKETYAQDAAENFTVTEIARGTLVLRGPCPRCKAFIDIPVVANIFRSSRAIGGWLRGAAPKTAEASHEEPMMCTCENEHPGRPEGGVGCGAYWILKISPAAP